MLRISPSFPFTLMDIFPCLPLLLRSHFYLISLLMVYSFLSLHLSSFYIIYCPPLYLRNGLSLLVHQIPLFTSYLGLHLLGYVIIFLHLLSNKLFYFLLLGMILHHIHQLHIILIHPLSYPYQMGSPSWPHNLHHLSPIVSCYKIHHSSSYLYMTSTNIQFGKIISQSLWHRLSLTPPCWWAPLSPHVKIITMPYSNL